MNEIQKIISAAVSNCTKEEFEDLKDFITVAVSRCTKEVLTFNEAAKYMGLSKSHLYKLTMLKQIPYYKPNGKRVYFNRLELERWLQTNRVQTIYEIQQQSQNFCNRKGGVL